MDIGDRIVVTSHTSTFYGRIGTLEDIRLVNESGDRTPLGYHVRIDGFSTAHDRPIPFAKREIRPASPSGFSGASD